MDIEAELVALINSLTGFQAATRYPDPRPEQFIQIRRQGGTAALANASSTSVFRDKPLIDLYISGLNEDEVHAKALQVRDFMLRLPTTQPLSKTCYGVSEVVFTWSDDELDGVFIAPRMWLSYDLNIRY
jgi:hypothetical protein